MSFRTLLNVHPLIFAVSGALLGVSIAATKQTYELEVDWWLSPNTVRIATLAAAVFGGLTHLAWYATFIIPALAPSLPRISSYWRISVFKMTLVLGIGAMMPLSWLAETLGELPYHNVPASSWSSIDALYANVTRMFNETAVDEAQRRDRFLREVTVPLWLELNRVGWLAIVNTRVAGLCFGALALGWTLVGLLAVNYVTTLFPHTADGDDSVASTPGVALPIVEEKS